MMFKDEAAVRKWVSRIGTKTIWNEASRGGTDGKADVDIILPNGDAVPTELKCWELLVRSGDFAARLRREQVRLHYVMNKAGRKTMILWGSPNIDGLFVIPGSRAPREVVSRVAPWEARRYERNEGNRLLHDMATGVIWAPDPSKEPI